MSLSLLEAWTKQHAVSQTPTEATDANIQEVPRWVDALLLCLDMGMQPQPAPQPEQSSSGAVAAPPTSAPAAAPSLAAPAAQQTPPAAAPAPAAEAATAPVSQPAAAESDQTAAAPSKPAAEEKQGEPPATKSTEERQQAANQMLRDNIKTMFLPNGLLSQQQLERAATVCMKLLQHLHAWGSVWKVPAGEPSENEAFSRAQPASTTQAVIQVLARVTKSHQVALKVSAGCLRYQTEY